MTLCRIVLHCRTRRRTHRFDKESYQVHNIRKSYSHLSVPNLHNDVHLFTRLFWVCMFCCCFWKVSLQCRFSLESLLTVNEADALCTCTSPPHVFRTNPTPIPAYARALTTCTCTHAHIIFVHAHHSLYNTLCSSLASGPGSYYLLLKDFPFIELLSPKFLAAAGKGRQISPLLLSLCLPSCVIRSVTEQLCFTALVIVDHFSWFYHFSTVYYLDFNEIVAFFLLCVWLVPFMYFISLSANESTLPYGVNKSM